MPSRANDSFLLTDVIVNYDGDKPDVNALSG